MNIKDFGFGKIIVIFVFVFTLLFAGCDLKSEDDEDGRSGENYLTKDVWTDGKFSKDGQVKIYYISVTKGTQYFIYMNNAYSGDGLKTAQSGLRISHSEGTTICDSYGNAESIYTKPYTFRAPSTGIVTIMAASYTSGYGKGWKYGTGTYAIKYTSRPEYNELSEYDWKDDIIIADGQTNKYSIQAKEKTRYFIYMNNAYDGDGLKTAESGLKISHSDGTIICDSYGNAESIYRKPYTFTSSSDGTITITAASYTSGYGMGWCLGTGTYAVRYTSRQEYDVLSDEWKDDSIIADGQTNKYRITVTKGKQYHIYMNNAYSGDGTKTAQTGLKIMYEQDSYCDNPVICGSYGDAESLYTKPYTFTAPSDGTITITAASYTSGYGMGWGLGTGTYAIRYTSN